MSKTRNVTAGTIGSSECSATLGEFTDAMGNVHPCRNLGIEVSGSCKGLRRIEYWNWEIGLTTAHILPHEFRPDARRDREQERLRHMEAHSNDIYGKSPNDDSATPVTDPNNGITNENNKTKRGERQYWTVFPYGTSDTICSKHKTLAAARNAAKHCESQGGIEHWIAEVRRVK